MIEIFENKIDIIQKYIEIERIPCLSIFSNILSVLSVAKLELCVIAICRNVINSSLVVGENKEKNLKRK